MSAFLPDLCMLSEAKRADPDSAKATTAPAGKDQSSDGIAELNATTVKSAFLGDSFDNFDYDNLVASAASTIAQARLGSLHRGTAFELFPPNSPHIQLLTKLKKQILLSSVVGHRTCNCLWGPSGRGKESMINTLRDYFGFLQWSALGCRSDDFTAQMFSNADAANIAFLFGGRGSAKNDTSPEDMPSSPAFSMWLERVLEAHTVIDPTANSNAKKNEPVKRKGGEQSSASAAAPSANLVFPPLFEFRPFPSAGLDSCVSIPLSLWLHDGTRHAATDADMNPDPRPSFARSAADVFNPGAHSLKFPSPEILGVNPVKALLHDFPPSSRAIEYEAAHQGAAGKRSKRAMKAAADAAFAAQLPWFVSELSSSLMTSDDDALAALIASLHRYYTLMRLCVRRFEGKLRRRDVSGTSGRANVRSRGGRGVKRGGFSPPTSDDEGGGDVLRERPTFAGEPAIKSRRLSSAATTANLFGPAHKTARTWQKPGTARWTLFEASAASRTQGKKDRSAVEEQRGVMQAAKRVVAKLDPVFRRVLPALFLEVERMEDVGLSKATAGANENDAVLAGDDDIDPTVASKKRQREARQATGIEMASARLFGGGGGAGRRTKGRAVAGGGSDNTHAAALNMALSDSVQADGVFASMLSATGANTARGGGAGIVSSEDDDEEEQLYSSSDEDDEVDLSMFAVAGATSDSSGGAAGISTALNDSGIGLAGFSHRYFTQGTESVKGDAPKPANRSGRRSSGKQEGPTPSSSPWSPALYAVLKEIRTAANPEHAVRRHERSFFNLSETLSNRQHQHQTSGDVSMQTAVGALGAHRGNAPVSHHSSSVEGGSKLSQTAGVQCTATVSPVTFYDSTPCAALPAAALTAPQNVVTLVQAATSSDLFGSAGDTALGAVHEALVGINQLGVSMLVVLDGVAELAKNCDRTIYMLSGLMHECPTRAGGVNILATSSTPEPELEKRLSSRMSIALHCVPEYSLPMHHVLPWLFHVPQECVESLWRDELLKASGAARPTSRKTARTSTGGGGGRASAGGRKSGGVKQVGFDGNTEMTKGEVEAKLTAALTAVVRDGSLSPSCDKGSRWIEAMSERLTDLHAAFSNAILAVGSEAVRKEKHKLVEEHIPTIIQAMADAPSPQSLTFAAKLEEICEDFLVPVLSLLTQNASLALTLRSPLVPDQLRLMAAESFEAYEQYWTSEAAIESRSAVMGVMRGYRQHQQPINEKVREAYGHFVSQLLSCGIAIDGPALATVLNTPSSLAPFTASPLRPSAVLSLQAMLTANPTALEFTQGLLSHVTAAAVADAATELRLGAGSLFDSGDQPSSAVGLIASAASEAAAARRWDGRATINGGSMVGGLPGGALFETPSRVDAYTFFESPTTVERSAVRGARPLPLGEEVRAAAPSGLGGAFSTAGFSDSFTAALSGGLSNDVDHRLGVSGGGGGQGGSEKVPLLTQSEFGEFSHPCGLDVDAIVECMQDDDNRHRGEVFADLEAQLQGLTSYRTRTRSGGVAAERRAVRQAMSAATATRGTFGAVGTSTNSGFKMTDAAIAHSQKYDPYVAVLPATPSTSTPPPATSAAAPPSPHHHLHGTQQQQEQPTFVALPQEFFLQIEATLRDAGLVKAWRQRQRSLFVEDVVRFMIRMQIAMGVEFVSESQNTTKPKGKSKRREESEETSPVAQAYTHYSRVCESVGRPAGHTLSMLQQVLSYANPKDLPITPVSVFEFDKLIGADTFDLLVRGYAATKNTHVTLRQLSDVDRSHTAAFVKSEAHVRQVLGIEDQSERLLRKCNPPPSTDDTYAEDGVVDFGHSQTIGFGDEFGMEHGRPISVAERQFRDLIAVSYNGEELRVTRAQFKALADVSIAVGEVASVPREISLLLVFIYLAHEQKAPVALDGLIARIAATFPREKRAGLQEWLVQGYTLALDFLLEWGVVQLDRQEGVMLQTAPARVLEFLEHLITAEDATMRFGLESGDAHLLRGLLNAS